MTITRYITWELLGWLAIVLVGLTCVLVLMVVVLEASRMNLGLGPTLRLLALLAADGTGLRRARARCCSRSA